MFQPGQKLFKDQQAQVIQRPACGGKEAVAGRVVLGPDGDTGGGEQRPSRPARSGSSEDRGRSGPGKGVAQGRGQTIQEPSRHLAVLRVVGPTRRIVQEARC